MAKEIITQKRLKEVLHYDSETGVFTWLVSSCVKIGNVAGTTNSNGYIIICIDRKQYRAHRLAWLYVHGDFPDEDTDHINHIRGDNRINNIRCVSRQCNMRNASMKSNNKSGIVGVSWHKGACKWVASIRAEGHSIHLGTFDDIGDAEQARKDAGIKYGFHENHGC